MKSPHQLVLSIATLLYLFLVYQFWFVCDDAYISFRYSKNLAEGLGLTYNVGGQLPVEGYSNFLVVLIGAGIEYLGLKIDFWIPLLSAFCGLGLLRAVYLMMQELGYAKNAASIAYLTLAIFPPFFIWSSSGMEAVAMSFFLFQSFRNLVIMDRPYRASGYTILLSLIRAEGICWGLIIAGLTLFRFDLNKILKYLLPLIIVFSGYFIWRYNYFQELLPNTVVNKVGGDSTIYLRGLKYFFQYFLTFLIPLLILPGALCLIRTVRWQWALPIIVLTIGLLVYPITVGGDFMTMFRFYAPLFPFQAILIAALFNNLIKSNWSKFGTVGLLTVIVLSLLPTINRHLVPTSIRSKLHIRNNTEQFRSEIEQWKFMKTNSARWQELGRAIKLHSSPGDTLVAGAIGNLGYFSGLYIYDRFGLVEPRVAKRQVRNIKSKSPGHDKAVPAEFFLIDRPTFLKAYLLIGDRNNNIEQQMLALGRKKTYQDYQPIYYPLERKLTQKKLGLLVLKRKPDV